jgi:hypothetical protein
LWQDDYKRRQFFEKYAKDNNFDPLNREEWYMQSRGKIATVEVWILFYSLICNYCLRGRWVLHPTTEKRVWQKL